MFKRTKLATKDLGHRIKKFCKEELLWHFLRNMTWIMYYGVFIYIIIEYMLEKNVSIKYRLTFGGISLLTILLLVLFIRIVSKIRHMEKGYLKILLNGLLFSSLMFCFMYLSKCVQVLEINLILFFKLIFVLTLIKTILLLVDEFIFTGFRLNYEQK